MNNCAECGNKPLPDDLFCAECGAAVTDETFPEAPPRKESSEHVEEVPTATGADFQSTEPLGADASRAPDEPNVADTGEVVVEPEEVERPPPASVPDDSAKSQETSSTELQRRLDQAIHEYTEGNISASTLSRIEAQLETQITAARTTEDVRPQQVRDAQNDAVEAQFEATQTTRDQDDGNLPEAASANTRHPNIGVDIPANAEPTLVRSRVHTALMNAGKATAAGEYLREEGRIRNDFDELIAETAKWVNLTVTGTKTTPEFQSPPPSPSPSLPQSY